MRSVAFFAAVSLAAAPASAAYDGCFSRSYDASHMAAHKGQTVTNIKMRLSAREMGDAFKMGVELRFGFRGKDGGFFAVGACKEDGDRAICNLDQDAGQFTLKPSEGGFLLSPLQDLRADSETGNEEDYVPIKTSNPEDRVFALKSAAATDCLDFDDPNEGTESE